LADDSGAQDDRLPEPSLNPEWQKLRRDLHDTIVEMGRALNRSGMVSLLTKGIGKLNDHFEGGNDACRR